jgi:hypothetical protein
MILRRQQACTQVWADAFGPPLFFKSSPSRTAAWCAAGTGKDNGTAGATLSLPKFVCLLAFRLALGHANRRLPRRARRRGARRRAPYNAPHRRHERADACCAPALVTRRAFGRRA